MNNQVPVIHPLKVCSVCGDVGRESKLFSHCYCCRAVLCSVCKYAMKLQWKAHEEELRGEAKAFWDEDKAKSS